jgi:hypothetical protein
MRNSGEITYLWNVSGKFPSLKDQILEPSRAAAKFGRRTTPDLCVTFKSVWWWPGRRRMNYSEEKAQIRGGALIRTRGIEPRFAASNAETMPEG